jgi:hypothetical protein
MTAKVVPFPDHRKVVSQGKFQMANFSFSYIETSYRRGLSCNGRHLLSGRLQ